MPRSSESVAALASALAKAQAELRRARAFVQLGFFPLPLAQAYAWTAAIFVYELDALGSATS